MLEGETLRMKLAFGSGPHGTWRVSQDARARCRTYRFRFRDAVGRTWWYPEGGALLTTGEGGCGREYEARASS